MNYWSRLDNAGKLFPAARFRSETHVFRFVCELNEDIRHETLQRALDETMRRFPIYRCVLKRGLFWYYLDASDIQPGVREEYKQPCAPLYFKSRYHLLFEVTYYKRRINLEVFHALSDGTGAMRFIRSLVARYLCLRHGIKDLPDDLDASDAQMNADSFLHHYDGKPKTRRAKQPRACRLHGRRFSENRLGLMTGHMSVRAVLDEAHKYGATMTTYLCALLFDAVRENLSAHELRRPIVACVPVNLRNYFVSNTVRNFFGTISVEYQNDKADRIEDIIDKTAREFSENLTEEKVTEKMNSFIAIEKNLFSKVMPLIAKDVVMYFAYRKEQAKQTVTVSNVGIVRMPDALQRYIVSFDVFGSTDRLFVCACSYGDRLSVNFTSPFLSTDVQRAFFRALSSAGISVEITYNMTEGQADT